MPSKELNALAANAMEERRKELIAQPLSRIYPQLAEAAAGAILAALQEQFEGVENDPFIPQGAKDYIRKFLAASALGEQSE
ncbi:hypothetical protein HWX16_16300 [Ochrobactrum intermedium]|uniref:hypothetical protein n=1 Tax=Brucella intermedia TaxID=94625 RepID=UPI00159C5EA2|nr:hypothetical protein [Brucella intermedia]NVM41890.1 hypothetical protein [Brucella intermedia]